MRPLPPRTRGSAAGCRRAGDPMRIGSPGLDVGYPDEFDEDTGSRDRTLSEAIGPSVLPPPR